MREAKKECRNLMINIAWKDLPWVKILLILTFKISMSNGKLVILKLILNRFIDGSMKIIMKLRIALMSTIG